MSRHVQNADSSVFERRLRPIYDWLDSGNNKKALQECEKVLKKTPNLHCAKALKALTLLRMGKEDKSIVILDDLSGEKPTDEATLQAMTLCYREMQQLENVCKLYETAVKIDPTNEELHTHLFMSYVRINDFKAQQQSAMALYKQKPKNPYYCWNVMSIILQATRGEGAKDDKKRGLLLSLAERMMEKLVDDNKIDAEQEYILQVQLYIMILELQNKYEKIISILSGPLNEKLQCMNIPQMKLTYLKKLKLWSQVNILSKIILNESFDKWDVWKEYVNSVFEVMSSEKATEVTENMENELETADNTPEKCHEFICSTIESGAVNSFQLRGPFLARFELCSKLKEKNINSKDVLGDVIELFIEYFRKFGHKPCCVSDLRIYLKLLDNDKKSELATKLVKEVGISATSVPQSLDQMQRHIGALQLSRLCGAHRNLTPEHLRALVTALSLHYEHGYQRYGKGLPSTDLGPSDNYAILAAHILYDLSVKENSPDSLVSASALLENLLTNSPSNFHAKLLLLKFYHILGNGRDANNIYHSLDIKHLQLDSLGYVHCGRLSTTGLFSLCTVHFDNTLKFFSSNYRDSTDHLAFSYKFGSFMKLDEFMDFREKLNNSMHYTTTVVDRIILSLLDCSSVEGLYNLDISPKDNKIEWNNLRDNRDLQVYMTWEPEFAAHSVEESKEVNRLFSQDLKFLRLRAQILASLSSAVEVIRSVDGVRKKKVDSLKLVLKEWKEVEDSLDNSDLTPISQELVSYPMTSRLHCFIETPYRVIITSLLDFLICLALESTELETVSARAEKEIETISEVLQRNIVNKSSDFREKRKEMEIAVNLVEVISICCMICHMCNEMLKHHFHTKKGKKKPSELKFKDPLNVIVDRLKIQITKFRDVMETWPSNNVERDFQNILESLDLNVNCNSLRQNIVASYAASNKEIQEVLKSKLKMLNSL